jgi:hypothetical protein
MVLWFYGCMKTTLEVPDDLYALVKARAALEGRTLRAVMEELLKEWVAPRAQAGTAAQRHSGTDEEGKEAGLVAEDAGESYGGTKEGKRKRGAGSETAEKVYPWDVLRLKWEREHNPYAPIDQIAGTLKEPGPDLDMEKAREAYMRDIAHEWKRREAKGGTGRGDASGAGNAEGNGSRET